jgi:hypothetical protein
MDDNSRSIRTINDDDDETIIGSKGIVPVVRERLVENNREKNDVIFAPPRNQELFMPTNFSRGELYNVPDISQICAKYSGAWIEIANSPLLQSVISETQPSIFR